jgi:hypothetical protein
LKVIIADHEFSYKWDDIYYFALSDYPNVSMWELRKLICMSDSEKAHGREIRIVCENDAILQSVQRAFAKPETVMHAEVPKKITECTACKQQGCLTEFVCHTTSIENAKSIFSCGKILSAIKARGKTGDELAKEPGNAAGDPPDFFQYVMFAFGNCQAGDRLVMESMLGRMPTELDISTDFQPGVRFYFVHNDIINHPNYILDGFDPAKVKDEIMLSDYLFACIIPKEHEQEFEDIIPSCLAGKVFYIENDCRDIWDWSEKVYNFVVSLSSSPGYNHIRSVLN